jgi:hypothetical protein
MASRFRGGKSAKRLVKNIPDAMRAELAQALDEGGNELLAAMRARAPRRTGKLESGIQKKVYPKTLRLRVGLFAATRRKLGLFYAHILEYGRKAQTVTISRGPRAGAKMRVTALPERHFITGPLGGPRVVFRRKLKGVWERVLKQAAGGVGND